VRTQLTTTTPSEVLTAGVLGSRRVARQFRVFARAGGWGFFVMAVCYGLPLALRRETAASAAPAPMPWWVIAAGWVVGLGVGVYLERTLPDPPPPKSPVPRRQWQTKAASDGIALALGVGFVAWYTIGMLVITLGRAASLPGVPVPYWTIFVVPALLAGWAFTTRRALTLAILANQEPPGLRLAALLRERAASLEQALQEATTMTSEMQRTLEAEQALLGQVQADYDRTSRLNELTGEQVEALFSRWSLEQARGERRALWVNVAVGFAFYVLGVLTPALVTTDAVRNLLRSWFHIG